MSGLNPGFIANDLGEDVENAVHEDAENGRYEENGTEIPPKISLLTFKENEEIITGTFKPVSAEEQKKGAAMYVQLLLIERDAEIAAQKRLKEGVDTLIKLQNSKQPKQSAVARAYWQRQILLGRV